MTTAEDINAAIAARHRFPSALKEAIGDVIGPMIDALGAAPSYVSPWQTWSAGTLYDFTHLLGGPVKDFRIQIKCITTERGYAVDDTMLIVQAYGLEHGVWRHIILPAAPPTA